MITLEGNFTTEAGVLLGNWYASQTKKPLLGPYSAIGWINEQGQIQGAAIFCNYNGHNIDIHIHCPKCITRSNYKRVLSYIFNEIKCSRLSARIKKDNKNLLRLMTRLGFIYETVLPYYYGKEKNDGAVVYRLTPIEASKWIKING